MERSETRVFDFHVHLGLAADESDLFEVPPRAGFERWLTGWARPGADGGRRHVLMPPTFYAWPNGLEDTRRLNDLVFAAQRADRRACPAAFGVVEPHHGEAALDEIDRVANELGMTGLVWRHRGHGVFADVPIMAKFVARAAERALLPVFHVTPRSGNEALWRVWRLAEQFPDVPMVALGALSSWDQVEQIVSNPGRAPNLRYETSEMSEGPRVLDRLVVALGAERLLYGSGVHNLRDAEVYASAHAAIAGSDLPPRTKERILWRNASELLRLEPS
jgi:predicted TIM-barrel fold metal-dependent hydrolase